MRKIVGASLLLAALAVASGLSGAALATSGAGVDSHQSSLGVSSGEGPTMDGSTRASGVAPFFWDDDDEDEDDDADEEDEDEGDDDDGDDTGPPDHAGPPDDDDEADDDQADDDQSEDDQSDDGQEGSDQGDVTDTSPPTASTPSPPPEPPSITPDSMELPPAQFAVSAATHSDATLVAGDSVRIDVRVENTALQEGTYDVALLVDGETVDTETVAVGAGSAETRTFERRFDEPGEYDIAVGNTSLGTVNVTDVPPMGMAAAPQEPPHSIAVVSAIAPADWVREGHRTTVRMRLVNTANRTAIRTFTVMVGGKPVAVETVSLEPNEIGVHSIDFAAVGGPVAVDGVAADRIDVGQATETEWAATDDANVGADTGLDLGVFLLLSVLVTVSGAAGHVARRRR